MIDLGHQEIVRHQRGHAQLWSASVARYGTYVPGYKRSLAELWKDFFEGSKPDEARAAIEARLKDAWESTIVEPLRTSTRAASDLAEIEKEEAA